MSEDQESRELVVISGAELEEMRQRCDASTEGPWEEVTDTGSFMHVAWALCVAAGEEHGIRAPDSTNPEDFIQEDSAFIAHSRTDLPRCIRALTSTTRALRRILDRRHSGIVNDAGTLRELEGLCRELEE